MFYVPLAQNVDYQNSLMKKLEFRSHFIGGILLVTRMSPGALEAQLTRLLADLDPNLTINSVRTMQQQIALSFDQERAVASLAGLFGIVALILAAVGLYGVNRVFRGAADQRNRHSHGAWRRPPQGNSTRAARRVQACVIGLLLGLPLAVGAGRLISAQLYGVSSWDPPALSVATVSLAICSFFAPSFPQAVQHLSRP